MNNIYFLKCKKGGKRERGGRTYSGVAYRFFRERTSDFSLKYRAIQPSEVFGPRRKAALRGEAYAWTPVLGSFVKLREVGVSPYLSFILYLSMSFILYLSTLLMFELNEAVRGRLIGPKSWDRIVIIFETQMVQPVTVHD